MQTYDVLTIGGGPGGISIARHLKGKKLGVIRPEDHSLIYCAMPYVVEGTVNLEKTFKSDSIVTNTGAELIRDKVESVDFDRKRVMTQKGQTYGYEQLVIATGSIPVYPNIPGITLEGIYTVKTENDLREIIELKNAGLESAIVVGAGAIGIELAQALNSQNVAVTLVDLAPCVLSSLADEDMIIGTQEALVNHGIKLLLNTQIAEISGQKVAEKVVLSNGDVYQLENKENQPLKGALFFAVSMKADVNIFNNSPLKIGPQGIVVNFKMETNIPDVYAIGDCVQFESAITGKLVPGKLATNAVPMGKVAARNMMGYESEYLGYFNGAATKVYNWFIGGTGLSERTAKQNGYDVMIGYGEMTHIFPILPGAVKVKVKLIADKATHELLGGQILSEEPVASKIDLLTFAIQKHTSIEELSMLSYSAQPYQSFFPANNPIVEAADQILVSFKG